MQGVVSNKEASDGGMDGRQVGDGNLFADGPGSHLEAHLVPASVRM